MAKPFLFRCPVTGLNVQGLTTDETETSAGRKDQREMVRCLACGGVHLVDPSRGPKPPPRRE